jgi:hypothetical protein
MKMKAHDDIVETLEPVPSQRELYQLIKIVLHKNSVLENELRQLKKIVNIRHKKDVLECLNQNKNDQLRTWIEWYRSVELEEEDLKMALENDLTKAMEHIFKKKVSKGDAPIYWFKEKPQQLFLYDGIGEPVKKAWKIASHTDIEKMVMCWSHALLKKFVVWQNDNRAFFIENDKNKDLEILYMSRISGIKNPVEKRTAEMKKWLYGFSGICYDLTV